MSNEECLKLQGRFKHLFNEENKDVIVEIQNMTDMYWKKLKLLEKINADLTN